MTDESPKIPQDPLIDVLMYLYIIDVLTISSLLTRVLKQSVFVLMSHGIQLKRYCSDSQLKLSNLPGGNAQRSPQNGRKWQKNDLVSGGHGRAAKLGACVNRVDWLRTSADKRMWSGRRAVVMVR